MKMHRNKSGVCQITGKHLPRQQLVSGTSIRKSILDLIKADHLDFDENQLISIAVLNKYRNPKHQEVIKRTRSENWYSEELFARFIPVKTIGTWNGIDPVES